MNKYIEFVEVPNPGKKTKVFLVRSKSGGATLGYVRWHGAWRQYTFNPWVNTVFNTDCLDTIIEFINGLMEERKKKCPGGIHIYEIGAGEDRADAKCERCGKPYNEMSPWP